MKRGEVFLDEHHLLFTKKEWELRPDGLALRQTKLLRPLISRETHNAIHRNVPPVPVLGYISLGQVRRFFDPGDTVFQAVDGFCRAIEQSARMPRAHELETDLGNVAIASLRLQLPFLAEELNRKVYL